MGLKVGDRVKCIDGRDVRGIDVKMPVEGLVYTVSEVSSDGSQDCVFLKEIKIKRVMVDGEIRRAGYYAWRFRPLTTFEHIADIVSDKIPGSCTCGTKTAATYEHRDDCTYRRLTEILEACHG